MKKSFIIILFEFIIFPIISQNINTQDINNVALNFINTKAGRNSSIKTIDPIKLNNQIVIYLIHFNEGGWILLSNDYRTKPILGYSLKGNLDTNKLPPALYNFLYGYKKQIINVKTHKSSNQQLNKEWQNFNTSKKLLKSNKFGKGSDIFGLLETSRGLVLWGQDENNDGGCTPSYNQYCPNAERVDVNGCWFDFQTSAKDCSCGHKSVGCAAVAMGQIMWYWQFPNSYNWSIIPTELFDNTPTNSANELDRLLYNCAQQAQTMYCCKGSYATTDNIVNALNNFGYSSAQKKNRADWPGNTEGGWKNLLRAELDVGRPVLYRGGALLAGNAHYFVCDGYDRNDPDYFHFNWGWWEYPASYPESGSCFTIDNLYPPNYGTGSNFDFTPQQQMIIGISPYCNSVPKSIASVPYSTAASVVSIAADNISLPETGSKLVVEPGGNLTLTACNSINLKQGFHASAGSNFAAQIQQICNCPCGSDISLKKWTNPACCYINGYNLEI